VLKMRGADTALGRHSFRIDRRGLAVFRRLETTLPDHVAPLEGRAGFGLDELDAMLGGGIPIGDASVLLGPSGVGKTMLALHFMAAGLERGERCLHISFQETEDQLLEKTEALGWDLTDAVRDRLIVHHVPPVELDLDEVGALVRDELGRGGVKRVVVDSLAELAFAARETERFPAYVWTLGGFARSAGATTLFTNEMAALGRSVDVSGLSFLFNNVLFLRYVEVGAELRRGVNVIKMRRSDHEKGIRDFRVGPGGIVVGDPLESVSGLLGWSALSGHEPTF
jgi:circadian clock protein KaiC